jgi:hypothetical protein
MVPIRASLCLLLLSAAAVKDRYAVVVRGGRVVEGPAPGIGPTSDGAAPLP